MPTLKPPRIKKAGVGRPHKLPVPERGRHYGITEEKIENFLQEIRAGSDPKDAWLITGLSESAWYVYQKRGKDEESGYFRELVERIHRAEADYIKSIYVRLDAHPKLEPRDLLAILERRSRKVWAPPKQALEVEGELRGGNTTIINIVSPVPRVEKPTERPLTLEARRQKMLGAGEEKAG